MHKRLLCTLAAASLSGLPAAAAERLVEISGLRLEELAGRSFELVGDQQVEVFVRAFNDQGRFGELCDAWILDAASREPVWTLRSASGHRRDRMFVDHTSTTTLRAGRYEAYLSTYRSYKHARRDTSVAGWIAGWVDWLADWDDYAARSGEIRFELRGAGRPGQPITAGRASENLDRLAIVSLRDLGDSGFARRGFTLSRPTRLRLYAVGELSPDGAFDSGWLVDAHNSRRIWALEYEHSRWAGGAKKNRSVKTDLTLPAGDYIAYWGSDDSHSSPRWNSAPPYDPFAWGLTISVAEPAARASIRPFQPAEHKSQALIVDLTRVGDGELRSAGFRLAKPMEVQVLAIGEGVDGEMSDYGWIVDAKSHEKVWKMRYERTEPAGGSQKNRRVDERLQLPAGSYIASFVTDGSHAYGSWNASPPMERDRWGLTILGGEGYDPRAVEELPTGEASGRVLALIDRVGNRADEIERFELTAATEVHVFALGEGSYGEMFDFGWIEDRSGREVWKMTYDQTERAGGSAKNRLFRGTLKLPAGSYRLRYRSDGSHAFGRWNAPPPHHPEAWGISVSVPES